MFKSRILLTTCILVAAGFTGSSAAEPERGSAEEKKDKLSTAIDPKLPNVLIIGDSISIGYMKPLQVLLKGKANVIHPPQNCESTEVGIKNMSRWLGNTKWAVVHFNFGLHDLKHVSDTATGKPSANPKDPRWVEPAKYRANLESIVGTLKASGAKLIFATTTPAPEDNSRASIYRTAADVPVYNDLAKQVMATHQIAVDDLFAFAKPRVSAIQKPKNVHFTDGGSEALAQEVARTIETALGSAKP